jgi:hypothetical protein
MKQKNPAIVDETYQYFATTFSSPPRMSHEGMRAAIDMLQQRSPETKFDTNVAKYVDERLMDELEKEGFFKRMVGRANHGRLHFLLDHRARHPYDLIRIAVR